MSRKQSQKLHFVGAAMLVFHLYFFPHSTKLRGLPLSTVTVSLHYLSRCLRSTAALQDLWPNLQKKARKRPIKLLKEAKHSSEADQRSQTLNLIKPKTAFQNSLRPNNSISHKNTSCVLSACT